jgi:ATP-dependent RNA helicase DDX3X
VSLRPGIPSITDSTRNAILSNMADQLNMGGLSLGEGGQQPSQNRSYIPPHMRRQGGPPAAAPAMNGAPAPAPAPGPGPTPGAGPGPNGLGNSAWAK